MKIMRKLLPLLLTAVLLLSASGGLLSAAAVAVGDNAGFGKVTETTSRTVAEGLTYESTTVAGTVGGNQQLHTLTFNPKTSDYMPIVYSQYTGYGATTLNSAKRAESVGYDVKGGVNAAFFSFTGKSANTYNGVNICDGKILQGCNNHTEAWELIFNSDGTSALVKSKVSYSLSAQCGAWNAPLMYVNICPETTSTGTTTGTGIYYYDTFCGTKTDTKAAGVEVVFEKQDHTQLTVGGTLVGKAVEIRANTSVGNPVGVTQFVLYASDESAYASYLRSFAIGDVVEISAEETVASSKTAMENCSSAVVTYGYHIVENGKNVTANDGLGEPFNTARAQRSAIGIKPDGTLVLVASPGRTDVNTGLTVYELADYMISQGCVTAINLDGGGSTQMVVENTSGSLIAPVAYGRAVANSILIVARPEINAETETALQTLIANADALVNNASYTGDVAAVKAALTYAKAVSASDRSMPGDYTKAIMRLQDALDAKAPLRDLLSKVPGIHFAAYSDHVLVRLRAAYADALEVYKDGNATQAKIDAAYQDLLKWYNATGDYTENGMTYKRLTEDGNFYLSHFNQKIEDGDCTIFTAGQSIEQSATNLQWAAAILLRKNADDAYAVEKVVAGNGSASHIPAQLGFTVIPADCIVLGAHGKSNAPVREAAGVGKILVPHGFDIETQTIEIGAYFTLERPKPVSKIGDVDCNGRVETTDYMLLKRYILGSFKLTESGLALADIDRNGKVEATDYMLLKRAILGTYVIADANA